MWLPITLAVFVFLALAFRGLGLLAWTASAAVILIGWRLTGVAMPLAFMTTAGVLIVVAAVFGIPLIRRHLVSRFIMPIFAKVLPRLGDTERVALEAGTVWWDADLFSGMPEWQKLLDFKPQPLSAEEQAFLDG
ncbi:MAG: acyl-CoA dehydrogenase, partial [Dokdonella sp.]